METSSSNRNKLINKDGPILVVEDDEDDRSILEEVFRNLDYSNKVIFFGNGIDALNYLHSSGDIPFLILSDINMPKLNGLALRQKLKEDADLHLKCIPYLFFSTALNQRAVIDAYSTSVQGFFVKESSMPAIQKTISVIMEYWMLCAAPNNF